MKPYYSDGLATLYLGDCEQVLPELAQSPGFEAPHIVITSPPYNMGLVPGGGGRGMYRPAASSKGGRFRDGYGHYHDALPQEEYDQWQRRVLEMLWDIIPPDGSIWYNHRQRIEHGRARLPLGMDFGIPLRQVLTWDRGTAIGPSRRHFAVVAEWICLFAKQDFMLRDHSASGAGDVWRLGMARRRPGGHPAPFPESLPARAIDSVREPRSVLDPFAGSGTTLAAATRLGIPSAGIEQDERYCEMTALRLSQGTLPAGQAAS